MKKSRIKMVILACLVFLLSSCNGISVTTEEQVCAIYSVPGLFAYDLKGMGDSAILERDSYGRTLNQYTYKNYITDTMQTVFVICQMVDEDEEYIYYYEDINYLVEVYTEEELNQLKQENDWEKPLDESKMSRRDCSYTFDVVLKNPRNDVLSGKEVRVKIFEILKMQEETGDSWRIDTDAIGQETWVASFEKNGETTKYFALVDLSYNVSVMEIELVDGFIDKEAYANFKKDNGWVYGWVKETGDGGLS
jgi:hypothetical protein